MQYLIVSPGPQVGRKFTLEHDQKAYLITLPSQIPHSHLGTETSPLEVAMEYLKMDVKTKRHLHSTPSLLFNDLMRLPIPFIIPFLNEATAMLRAMLIELHLDSPKNSVLAHRYFQGIGESHRLRQMIIYLHEATRTLWSGPDELAFIRTLTETRDQVLLAYIDEVLHELDLTQVYEYAEVRVIGHYLACHDDPDLCANIMKHLKYTRPFPHTSTVNGLTEEDLDYLSTEFCKACNLPIPLKTLFKGTCPTGHQFRTHLD